MPIRPRAIDLTDLGPLRIHATSAEVVTFRGRPALRLVDGLVLWPEAVEGDLSLAVDIAAEGPCYAGLVFHAESQASHELIYAQPHTGGGWDALQYDPVFRRSNTWQIYHGPAYQQAAAVPIGSWFTLQVQAAGGQAAASVDGQAPLRVARLMHGRAGGYVGVWTYLPAHFTALRLGPAEPSLAGGRAAPPVCPPGTVTRWHLEGAGPIIAEENGTVNVNRHLDWQSGAEAFLMGGFSASRPTTVELRLGYSDELDLALDGELIHSGRCVFQNIGGYEGRGYVAAGRAVLRCQVAAGRHELNARLRTVEPFGWGLTVVVAGDGVVASE